MYTFHATEVLKETRETPYVSMSIEGDIMHCCFAGNLHVSLEVAKACVEARISFSRGKSYLLLIDMRGIKSTTPEARLYMASIGAKLVTAGALVTGSPLNRAIGNVFLAIDKPMAPAKLFTDESKAREWLMSFVEAAC